MLKSGDRVRIKATAEIGTVKQVHPHEIVVSVAVVNGHEERRYANESVQLDPTMNEASNFVDR
jgi:hypothetical protein